MILKVLLVIGVIGIVYFMFIKKSPPLSQKTTNKEDDIKADDMVECSSCSVYVQVSEAILSNAKYYCSQECLQKVV
ncbi:hypothetical protein JHD47_02115 [Sulfurimonas sp. SAG-AH-194-L11]|nr:PP0621 family protein [Sulfurimonas sp. SAG-AH-194-L11]MDF1876607.1 hypothetical protein [Sulfurimonas sp. SAG-AH-194-L11]